MSKDRARPFSRKHRRYWIPVTGGMILIGTINVLIGYCSYEPAPETHKLELGPLPPPSIARPGSAGPRSTPAGSAESIDAGVRDGGLRDAAPPTD